MKSTVKNAFDRTHIIKIFAISLFLGGCSSPLLQSNENEALALLPADEIKQGPGVFSGKKGGFFILNRNKNAAEVTAKTTSKSPVKSQANLDETSKVLESKIKQLEQDKIELELLKRQVDQQLQKQQ